MSIKIENFKEVIKCINKRFDMNYFRIDVKTIKKWNNIEHDNRSKTQFYRHILHELESQGFIEKKDGYYLILKRINQIEIEIEVDSNENHLNKTNNLRKRKIPKTKKDVPICQFCGRPLKKKKTTLTNIARDEIRYFCDEECKKQWVFKIQRQKNKKKRLK